VFLILILYELIAKWIKTSLFLRIYASMFVVLMVDTLLFVTGSFVEQPNYWSILTSAIIGKACTAAVYSGILRAYFRLLPKDSLAERDESLIGVRIFLES